MFTKLDNGFIIADSIYIGTGQAPEFASLTLRLTQWSSVVYDKTSAIIDYAGEYELSGYIVQAWADRQGMMNYGIRYGQKKLFFIQSAEGLDNDIVTNAHTWYVMNDAMGDLITRRELEGEVVLLAE